MKKIIQEICGKKNLEMNLPVFANYLSDIYYKTAAVEMTMDYYTLSEMIADAFEKYDTVKTFFDEFNNILSEYVLQKTVDANREIAVAKIDDLRNRVYKKVDILAAYADIFSRYEYVSNRCEYLFKEKNEEKDYSDEEFTKQIMQYIFSDEDNTVINSKISDIVSELPLRMTKSKFFEYLSEGLGVYVKTDKKTIDDFIYILKTSSMLTLPQNIEEYEDLSEIYNQVICIDYDTITEEQFTDLEKKLMYAEDRINEDTNMFMLLEGIINKAYVMILNQPYAKDDDEQLCCCKDILNAIHENLSSHEYITLDDKTTELFVKLEGAPEHLHGKISSIEYVLDTIKKDDLYMVKSIMAQNIYQSLFLTQNLMQDSLFIDLSDVDELFKDDNKLKQSFSPEEYISEKEKELVLLFTKFFKEHQKIVNKSVMAIVLSRLPVFFNNVTEIQDYVYYSLSNCTNKAEKTASIEIIRSIMNEI